MASGASFKLLDSLTSELLVNVCADVHVVSGLCPSSFAFFVRVEHILSVRTFVHQFEQKFSDKWCFAWIHSLHSPRKNLPFSGTARMLNCKTRVSDLGNYQTETTFYDPNKTIIFAIPIG
jgi:hypothetical protein